MAPALAPLAPVPAPVPAGLGSGLAPSSDFVAALLQDAMARAAAAEARAATAVARAATGEASAAWLKEQLVVLEAKNARLSSSLSQAQQAYAFTKGKTKGGETIAYLREHEEDGKDLRKRCREEDGKDDDEEDENGAEAEDGAEAEVERARKAGLGGSRARIPTVASDRQQKPKTQTGVRVYPDPRKAQRS